MFQVDQIVQVLWKLTKEESPHSESPCSEEMTDIFMNLFTREKPLSPFWSSFLECRPSPIAGNGVFAARAIPKEVVVTLYPADMIVRREREVLLFGSDDDTPEKQWGEDRLLPICDTYGYHLRDALKIIGLPSKIGDQRLLGHMMNDACGEDFFHGVPLEELRDPLVMRDLLTKYFSHSRRNLNCRFKSDEKSLILSIISLRELRPGEELFVTYGLEYWFSKNYGIKPFDTHLWILDLMKIVLDENPLLRNDAHYLLSVFDRC